MVHGLKGYVWSTMVTKLWQQECEVIGHSMSVVTKRQETVVSSLLPYFLSVQSRDLAHSLLLPTLRVGLHSAVNPLKKYPHRRVWGCLLGNSKSSQADWEDDPSQAL